MSGSLLREARDSGCLMNLSRWSLDSAYDALVSWSVWSQAAVETSWNRRKIYFRPYVMTILALA